MEYVKETLDEMTRGDSGPVPMHSELDMMRDEIGSWWRIDLAEIGAAARELVSD